MIGNKINEPFSTTAAFFMAETVSFRISSMISMSLPENETEEPDSSVANIEIGSDVPRPISVPSYEEDSTVVIVAIALCALRSLWTQHC